MSKDYRHLEESLLPSKVKGLEREIAKVGLEDVVLDPQVSPEPPESFYLVATLRNGPRDELVEVRTTAHVVTAKEYASWDMKDVVDALEQRSNDLEARSRSRKRVATLRTQWEITCKIDAFPHVKFTWTWEKGVVLPWAGQLRHFEERPTYRER